MSVEELFQRAERASEDKTFIRYDERHPHALYVGVEAHKRAMLLVCASRPPAPPSLAALHSEVKQRRGGEWALTIRLERPELSRLFNHLVEDLAETTRAGEIAPGVTVVEQLNRWQRMFARLNSGALTDHALRGLLGELVFLLDHAIPAVGAERAVQAWRGPFEAPQDFVFADRRVEVKATGWAPRAIQISSLEQLSEQSVPLYLWCCGVELERGHDEPPRSAASFVKRARAAVAANASAALMLEDALLAAGWSELPEYERCGVKTATPLCYSVRDDFPRVERRQVAAGVLSCEYTLDVASLRRFVVPTWRA